eukprot:m.179378 g.179378  ORF g.179378 m.179378 type:complete len:216 (-) comp15368_c0_seq2:89-736(-)
MAKGERKESAASRQKDKERAERERQEKAKEDASWEDDDPRLAKKAQRAMDKEKKSFDAAAKKAELKALSRAEEEKVAQAAKAKVSTPTAKVSRASIQIAADADRARVAKAAEEREAQRHGAVVKQAPLEENMNKLQLDAEEDDDAVDARTVEEALAGLGVGDDVLQRKMKMAFIQFQEDMLPRLQQQNPHLRRSQILSNIAKEWRRSPLNPYNQR